MNKILFTLLFTLLISQTSFGAEPACDQSLLKITAKTIECLVQNLIEKSFPELQLAYASGRIHLNEFQSDSYFLTTSILKGTLSQNPNQKTYSININSSLYDENHFHTGSPSMSALEGILAHELIHLVDYEKDSLSGLIEVGVELVLSPARYERATDRRAFERGYASGIRDYRKWLYPNLSPSALAVKRRRYYTPEQIDEWLLNSTFQR